MGAQEFTADGTFTWPAGVTAATVECWGGGGAGGIAINSGGGGGGGGGYQRKEVAKTAATAAVVVGPGGVTSGGSPSSFTQGAVLNCQANGGAAGNGRLGGAGGSGGTGDVGHPGGNGGTTVNAVGTGGSGGGGSAGSREAGDHGIGAGTNIGGEPGTGDPIVARAGSGGRGGDFTQSGTTATELGGGGGGRGDDGAARGQGFRGRVIVRWRTDYSRLKFTAAQCCPAVCAVPKVFGVDDLADPRQTRYPLSATVTVTGWHWITVPYPDHPYPNTPECGCCAAVNRSYVLSLRNTASINLAYTNGGTHPQQRYAVGTLNPTLGGATGMGVTCFSRPIYYYPPDDEWICDNDENPTYGTAVNLSVTATSIGLQILHGGFTLNFTGIDDPWEVREWESDCYPSAFPLVARIESGPFVLNNSLAAEYDENTTIGALGIYQGVSEFFTGPFGNGGCSDFGVQASVSFGNFFTGPLSGDNIITHVP